jgi:hypothetical protein
VQGHLCRKMTRGFSIKSRVNLFRWVVIVSYSFPNPIHNKRRVCHRIRSRNFIERRPLRMPAKLGLLRLFNVIGLPPSVHYTERYINSHKVKISKLFRQYSDRTVSFAEDGTSYEYRFTTFLDAVNQILSIMKIEGALTFYPVREMWGSHWNPLDNDQWCKPIPTWERSTKAY